MLHDKNLLDKINWFTVSGSQEVSRLPSHFIKIEYRLFDNPIADREERFKTLIRKEICNTCSGRYFIGLLQFHHDDHETLVVGFENKSEAILFKLRIDYIVSSTLKIMNENI